MSALRITILENNLMSLEAQKIELDSMIDHARKVLIEAYMENDASLTKVDTITMIGDLTE